MPAMPHNSGKEGKGGGERGLYERGSRSVSKYPGITPLLLCRLFSVADSLNHGTRQWGTDLIELHHRSLPRQKKESEREKRGRRQEKPPFLMLEFTVGYHNRAQALPRGYFSGGGEDKNSTTISAGIGADILDF